MVIDLELETGLQEDFRADGIEGEFIEGSKARIEKRDKIGEKDMSDEVEYMIFLVIYVFYFEFLNVI